MYLLKHKPFIMIKSLYLALYLCEFYYVFMKAFYLSILLSISFFSFGQKHTSSVGFIENKGQIVDQKGKENKNVKYLLNTKGLNVQLRQNGFSYDVYELERIPLTKTDKGLYSLDSKEKDNKPDFSSKINFHRIDIDFLNSNKNIQLLAEEKSTDYDNYYNVIHAPEGITNVHKYKKVTYKNIYNNIDVVFFIPKDSTKVVEYNFIVKPGGKVSDIQLKFNGAKTDLIDNKIQMNLPFGKMEETLPLSWIENDPSKEEISINYKKNKKNVYGFESELNNSNKTIVIDPVPVRLWGTYYGGNGNESIFETELDLNGNLYISGESSSFDNIATSGTHQTSLWPWSNSSSVNTDCFVSKFNSDGIRIWGSYLGGNVQDNIGGLAIDKSNNIVITGTTNSNLNSFTTPNAHQINLNYYYPGNPNNFDAFLVKLDTNGLIIWGTLFGGNLTDTSNSVAVDELNNIIIGGITYSESNIATPGAHKTTINNQGNSTYNGYFVKFNENGQRIWSTYFGGNMQDQIDDIKIDSNNNLYIVGFAGSNNGISTINAFQTSKSAYTDGFLSKFSSSGSQIWGTYFGGDGYDYFNKLKIANNSIYITGKTTSNVNISTNNSFLENKPQSSNSGYDGMIVKFDLNGNRMWSTYFYEEAFDLELDLNENIYFVGYTQLDNFISTPGSYDISRQLGDGFIQKFDMLGNRVWGSYYGGNSIDSLLAISYDLINSVFYVGGSTLSSVDISTTNSHQPNYSGYYRDCIIAKLQDCLSSPQASAINPCIGSNLQLTASGGTNYLWTGPNGFTSTDQNPIIPNVTTSESGQYLCEITGTGGCDNTITLNIVIGDTIAPVPNIASLPQINGDCNTVISSIPTALDNCAGAINATTTDPLVYSVPGNYTITWNFDDGNGNSSSQTQNVTITSVNPPTLTSPQTFCFQDNATISNIAITGQNITWYDALTGGNILASTTALQNGITYYATQTINNCESDRTPILVTIQNTPAPTGSATQTFCSTQNTFLNDISISGTNIIWYADNTSTTALLNSTALLDNTSYFATQTINGCESPTRFEVHIDLINTLNALDYQETICDDLDDGFEIINLTSFNSNLITTTGNTFSYYTSLNGAENQINSAEINNVSNYNLNIGTTTFFVRIDSQNGCHQVVELKLTLVSKPRVAISDIMPMCEGTSITINAGNGFDSYNWSTGATTQSTLVSQAGNYSVTVTENHNGISCSSTKNFTVVNSNAATVSEIITSDWTDNNNTITVLISNSSVGNYVYSLDGINYQNSNVFYGLESGEHTVFVKDINGCGISSEEIYLLMYPKYFTPNGDSYNDTWKIKFSQKEPNLKVAIFDRYGKLLKMMNSYDAWDGKLNGKDLPSDDYWFVVTRQNGKEFRGHFAMKR